MGHLLAGLDGFLELIAIVFCYFFDDGKLVVDLLCDSLPEIPEGFEHNNGLNKIYMKCRSN